MQNNKKNSGVKGLGLSAKKSTTKPSKSKPEMTGFEDEFFAFWSSLGFRSPLSSTSKTYQKNYEVLHKLLEGKFHWSEVLTLERIRQVCKIFKNYINSPNANIGKMNPSQLYFCDFVSPYKGPSFFRGVVEGKISADDLTDEEIAVAKIVAKRIKYYTSQPCFSKNEQQRINEYGRYLLDFYTKNQDKIEVGVGIEDIVKAVFRNINDFLKTKEATPSAWVMTGSYAKGSALQQAMTANSFWKVFYKYETINQKIKRKTDEIRKAIKQEPLPKLAKKRLQELELAGIETVKIDKEDCSRKEEYLKNKKPRKVFPAFMPFELPEGCYKEH
jgi:hypothetical protein